MRSMGSELSRKSFLKDYQRSEQIKKRLMRYEREQNNKVCLKADKVLSVSRHRHSLLTARLKKEPLPRLPNPKLANDPNELLYKIRQNRK